MRSKMLVISLVAMIGVAVLTVASAAAVFALVGDSAAPVEEAVEIAPAQLEEVSEPVIIEPVLQTKRVGHADGRGCPYQEAKMQQVRAPVDEIEDNLLTQASP